MSNEVDLRDLALDRDRSDQAHRGRQRLLTRYAFPLALLAAVLALMAWALRDVVYPPRPVTVVPVFSTYDEMRQEGARLFNAAGWIEPRPTPVRVAALAPGVVEHLLVVEDQVVKVSEPIAELVKDDAKLAHAAAMADLKLREAEVAEAKASLARAVTRFEKPVHLEAALGEAKASLAKVATQLANLPFETRRAEAEYEAAQIVYQRKLSAKGVVAGVEVDVAKSKAESAKALVEELRERSLSLASEKEALTQRRNALKTQLELLADETKERAEAESKVQGAEARLEQARVAVAERELALDRMTVKSPIDGRVFRLIAHPGARIGGGMTHTSGHDGSTIVTLYRPDMLQVRVDVRFEDIPKVSLNQPVAINNPALESPIVGKVLFVSSEADIQKNTLQVKVEIPDPPPVFKPEMLVDVTFLAPKSATQASNLKQELRLFVLRQLIHEDEIGSFVWVADQSDAVARKTRVQTGAVASNGLVEITEGLILSSRLIVRGVEGLRDGDRIVVSGEDELLGAGDLSPGIEPAAQSPLSTGEP